MSAQEFFVKLQAAEAEHRVWDTGGKGRNPAKRTQLRDELAALRGRAGQWARDMGKRESDWLGELQEGEMLSNDRSRGVMACRLHFAHILRSFGNKCVALHDVYNKAVSNYKSYRPAQEMLRPLFFVVAPAHVPTSVGYVAEDRMKKT